MAYRRVPRLQTGSGIPGSGGGDNVSGRRRAGTGSNTAERAATRQRTRTDQGPAASLAAAGASPTAPALPSQPQPPQPQQQQAAAGSKRKGKKKAGGGSDQDLSKANLENIVQRLIDVYQGKGDGADASMD